ncbi:ankyrin repeat-containing protein ITN1-like isoform X2 [Rhodamnia argentea]|uniref:Ankyrin repeat-containing protein ITN1-like isoform X2 n=1 Tax=Rhodamnia argentea TaxID=178133 RepID=A0ABM3HAU1_9MYRT|nr:ankyrin repeat-containing protein ITN1-like isoform X2 [Rhodamnia argentea]
MESELYEAALKGNVASLLELLGKDELLLDRIMTGNHTETPLHIAAMLGHLEFVEEVLARKAELAREQDSRSSTPLHLAAAKGYVNLVATLLRVGPEICFVRDKYERNPLHVAAMKGQVDVLELLVRTRPDAARSVIEHGQTILHLCVKHNRLEALKLLIDILADDQFINSRDEDGNTILHLAAADGQTKTILFLTNKGVNPNITNSKGFTALALLTQGCSMERASEITDSAPQILENHDPSRRTVHASNMVTAFRPPVAEENKKERKRNEEKKKERKRKWQNSMHKTLMVVAILLATMAFQAGMTPPGGIWDNDFEGNANHTAHFAGDSVMAQRYPGRYKVFIAFNTISFIASLSIIMLLISGLPLKRHRIFTGIAMLIMWVAITFTAATYAISILVFTPDNGRNTAYEIVGFAVLAWVVLMALLFLCHLLRLILKLLRKVLRCVLKPFRKRKPQAPIP